MGVYSGPTNSWINLSFSNSLNGLVTNGLVLALDAGRTLSYPGSGTTWTDLSGNGNTGTLINGPTFSSGNGGYFSFDGVNDYVSGNISSLSSFYNTTLECWVNVTRNKKGRFVGFGDNTSGYSICIGSPSGGNSGDITVNGSNLIILSEQMFTYNTQYTFSYDGWHHITTTLGSNNTQWNTYVNGQHILSWLMGLRDRYYITEFWIGSDPLFNGFPTTFTQINGVSQVRIYNRALTASEISQNFNALRRRFGI